MVSHLFCLVVNPAAARGRGGRCLPAALGVLAGSGATVRICQTASLGDAARLAAQATGRGEAVVAVGGDGLVGTLAAAVSRAGGLLGIIPAGRGNDFARMLGIPASPAAAAQALLDGEPRAVDLIGVRPGGHEELVVAGSVYLGIPSEGGEIANRSWWAAGAVGYQLAGVRALLGWQPATFTVEPGTAGQAATRFGGFCVVVANSVYLAAGRKAAPDADVSDGLLDVILVGEGRKLSFVEVMLRAGRGTHVLMDQVRTLRSASVTVTADRPMPAAADGETLASACPLGAGSPLFIRVLPGALRVITPAGGDAPGRASSLAGAASSLAGADVVAVPPAEEGLDELGAG